MHQLTHSRVTLVLPSRDSTSEEGIIVLHSGSMALSTPLNIIHEGKMGVSDLGEWGDPVLRFASRIIAALLFTAYCINPLGQERRGRTLWGWRGARMLTHCHHEAILSSNPPYSSCFCTPPPPLFPAVSAELCLNYLHCLPWAVSVAQCLFAPVELP